MAEYYETTYFYTCEICRMEFARGFRGFCPRDGGRVKEHKVVIRRSVSCPKCGLGNAGNDKYCSFCGAKLPPSKV